jgi:hypothetical protein
MHHPDFDQPFHVYFDASLRGIGGLLLQKHVDPNLWPSVQPAEINSISAEQEF